MAFEEAGADLSTEAGEDALRRFLCTNGPQFYGFPVSDETFSLVRAPSTTDTLQTNEGPVVPLPTGMELELTWSID
tara:strand:- start:1499 stop:1726 length:228 start_codon:yes stop_codon:yes gene_type:complete